MCLCPMLTDRPGMGREQARGKRMGRGGVWVMAGHLLLWRLQEMVEGEGGGGKQEVGVTFWSQSGLRTSAAVWLEEGGQGR